MCVGYSRLVCLSADALKENKKRWRTVRAHGTAVGLPSDAGERCCRPAMLSNMYLQHFTAFCTDFVRLHAEYIFNEHSFIASDSASALRRHGQL